MKSCPTCNRTYADDSFTFCLDDGALLSASYDPYSTLQIPTARNTDQAATEILTSPTPPGHSLPTQPQPTIRVSEPLNYAQAPVMGALHQTPRRKSGTILGIVIAILSVGVLLMGYFLWRGNQNSTTEISSNKSNVENNNTQDGADHGPVNNNGTATTEEEGSSTSSGTASRQWLTGVWEGTGTQHSPKMTWTLKVTAKDDAYTIEYPSLRCGGTWTLVEMGKNQAKFKEVITRGLERCSSDGDILIEKVSDDQVSYTYTLPIIGEVAIATLNKRQY